MREWASRRVGGRMSRKRDNTMGAETKSLFGDRWEWTRELATAAAAGLFLGLVGPFGSYLNQSRLTVLGYWIGTVLLGAILFGLTLRPAVRLAPRLGVPLLPALAAATVLAAIPMSLLCHALAMALWPAPIRRIGRLAWYAQTLLISAPLACGYVMTVGTSGPGEKAGEPPPQRAPDATSDLLSRLPPQLGRELLALQMEDHYVRAHTSRGSALILIPLRQAVTELTGIPGMKIHRSWWVARDAVTGVVQDGRNLRLRLANGLEAPVSRVNVAAVRQAGLFPMPD